MKKNGRWVLSTVFVAAVWAANADAQQSCGQMGGQYCGQGGGQCPASYPHYLGISTEPGGGSVLVQREDDSLLIG